MPPAVSPAAAARPMPPAVMPGASVIGGPATAVPSPHHLTPMDSLAFSSPTSPNSVQQVSARHDLWGVYERK